MANKTLCRVYFGMVGVGGHKFHVWLTDDEIKALYQKLSNSMGLAVDHYAIDKLTDEPLSSFDEISELLREKAQEKIQKLHERVCEI